MDIDSKNTKPINLHFRRRVPLPPPVSVDAVDKGELSVRDLPPPTSDGNVHTETDGEDSDEDIHRDRILKAMDLLDKQ